MDDIADFLVTQKLEGLQIDGLLNYLKDNNYDSDAILHDICNEEENINESYIGTYFQSINNVQCFENLRQFANRYSLVNFWCVSLFCNEPIYIQSTGT